MDNDVPPQIALRRHRNSFFRVALIACFCIAGAWLYSNRDRRGINHIPQPDTYCDVEVLAKPTVGAARFEIVDVACDALGHDDTVRIYELTSRKSWFGHLKNRETLVFAYDPGGLEDNLPQIAIDPVGKLTIAEPWISSIWYKTDVWNGRPIKYKIGRIDYP